MHTTLVAALVIATFGLTAPADAGESIGPVETLSFEVALVDDGRDRTVPTTITSPSTTEAEVSLPLVVLAHGNNGHPSKFTQLIDAWAGAGYVVAAPAFPSGSTLADQVADMSFVIDKLVAMSEDASSQLAGMVDKRHIGAAGLSLGGGTVYGLVFNTCCRDRRVDAVVLMSSLRTTFDEGKERFPRVPAMLIAGDADPISRVTENVYPRLKPPKWKIVLYGGTHSAPFEDTPDPADQVVRDITTEFWDLYLKSDKTSERAISTAVEQYCDAKLVNQLDRSTGEGFACSQPATESTPTT